MHLIDTRTSKSLELLRSDSPGCVIYGAGQTGALTADACEKLRIRIVAFCDNAPAKQGTTLRGIPVISPEKAAELYPEGNFILALIDPVAVTTAGWKLNALGVEKCFSVQFIEGVADDSRLVRHIVRVHDSLVTGGEELIFTTGMHITDQCTLRCADCGSFIPFIKSPISVPTSRVFGDIDTLCMCADEVLCLSIVGGEPLLHPDWDRILDYALGQEKIRSLYLITNGTILPRDDQWDVLQNDKVTIAVSDYEGLSTKAKPLAERLDALGVKTVYTKWADHHWYASMATKRMGLSPEALREHFLNCWFNNCTVVFNQRLYRCGPMFTGTRAGFFPENPGDSFDLSAPQDREAVLKMRAGIRSFLYEKAFFPTCDYCTGGGCGREQVRPAIQTLSPKPR